MHRIITTILIFFSLLKVVTGQSYSSYFTGNTTDKVVTPTGGICLMGGAAENDNAMRWFLERSSGGDILVLRTSGSDGYNNYMYNELGVTINSVETIVFNNESASSQGYIHNKIQKAEAIWFAGGDQWEYISYWRDSGIADLINSAIDERNIVIGGTSAGMAILGRYYFSAENGTVTSAAALSNPYTNRVKVDTTTFLKIYPLTDVITDTHYNNPVRKGRHMVFMARLVSDYNIDTIKGIGCDERTAICIDETGRARVFGNNLSSNGFAYFLQVNCASQEPGPEVCLAGTPLTWNRNSQSVKAYVVPGDNNGSNSFNLTTWKSGEGGVWENWSVQNGSLTTFEGSAPICVLDNTENYEISFPVIIYPNPVIKDIVTVKSECCPIGLIEISDIRGRLIRVVNAANVVSKDISLSSLVSGIYLVQVHTSSGKYQIKIVVNK